MTISLPIDTDANELLSASPLALLIGMLLDQQVTIEKAFTSPRDLVRRLGHEPTAAELAAFDPDALAAIFSERPALHRYPRAMAGRVQQLCQQIVDRYGGDPAGAVGRSAPVPSCWRGSATCPASARTRPRSSSRCLASSTASGHGDGARQPVSSARKAATTRSPTSPTMFPWPPSAPTNKAKKPPPRPLAPNPRARGTR